MIPFLSSRYAFSKSRGQKSRAIRAVLTIALSLVTVTVVMSIMDFLQNGRFQEIRDVRSFDCIVEGRHKDELSLLFPQAVLFEYGEGEALSESGAYQVRYISSDYDGGIRLLFGEEDGLLVPYVRLSAFGPSVNLSMLKKGKVATTMKTTSYGQSGIYWTKLGKEFDSTMLFLPLEEADESVAFYTAIKGVEGDDAKRIVEGLGYKATSWKEQESSLYGAFLLEKAMMYGVLSLLFIIIMVSLKQTVRIFIETRAKESAELEIVGLKRSSVLGVTLLAFFIVLFLGMVSGFILGALSLLVIERVSLSSPAIMDMHLSMPITGLVVFSLSLFLFVFITVLWEKRKQDNRDLWEVINGR